MLVNRRSALALTGGAAAGLMMPRRGLAQSSFAGQSVVYATWGGEYQDAQVESFVRPFEQKTGATVVVDGPVNAARVRVMLESQNYDWQVICAGQAMLHSLAGDGLLAELDTSLVDVSRIPEVFRHQYGVGMDVGASTVSYSTAAFEGRQVPMTWADIFDIERFPGRRMLNSAPQGSLEVALMADGVPPDQLYPLDIERAFAKLDTIKDETIFYQSNSQSQQLITDGAVSCGLMFSSRAYGAARGGAPIAISWEGNLRSWTPLFVPRGVENPEICWALINEMMNPQNQARMAELFVAAPSNPDAYDYISEEFMPWMPTTEENLARGVDLDSEFWGPNLASLTERWQEWLLS